MCAVQDGNRELLFAFDSRIYVYNTATDEVVWSAWRKQKQMDKKMEPHGVTTDGHGHLFVCDWNNGCIHLFHITKSKYLGPVMREGEQGLGVPYRVEWCEATSSLVVAYTKNDVYLNSFVKFQ